MGVAVTVPKLQDFTGSRPIFPGHFRNVVNFKGIQLLNSPKAQNIIIRRLGYMAPNSPKTGAVSNF